jgi:hypothetical protein
MMANNIYAWRLYSAVDEGAYLSPLNVRMNLSKSIHDRVFS